MYPVAKDDVLKRVATYEINRKFETLNITVEFVLTGKASGNYHADARFEDTLISSDFWGYGSTEGEALRDLLTKIKGIPFAKLIHPGDLPRSRGGA